MSGLGIVHFQHDEIGPALMEIVRQDGAQASETADDDMVFELVDPRVHAFEPEYLG